MLALVQASGQLDGCFERIFNPECEQYRAFNRLAFAAFSLVDDIGHGAGIWTVSKHGGDSRAVEAARHECSGVSNRSVERAIQELILPVPGVVARGRIRWDESSRDAAPKT